MEEYKAESEQKCPMEKGLPGSDMEQVLAKNMEKLSQIDFPADVFPDYKDDMLKLIAKYSENGEKITSEYSHKIGALHGKPEWIVKFLWFKIE